MKTQTFDLAGFKVGHTFDVLTLPDETIRAVLGADFLDIVERWRAEGSRTGVCTVVAIDADAGVVTFDAAIQPRVTTTIRVWPEGWSVGEVFDRPVRSVGRIGPLTEAWRRIRDEG